MTRGGHDDDVYEGLTARVLDLDPIGAPPLHANRGRQLVEAAPDAEREASAQAEVEADLVPVQEEIALEASLA